MQLTEKLKLKKPDLTDYVNIGDLNDNADTLDTVVGELKDGTAIVESLKTIDKTYVGAINEIKEKQDNMSKEMNIVVDSITEEKWKWKMENGVVFLERVVI